MEPSPLFLLLLPLVFLAVFFGVGWLMVRSLLRQADARSERHRDSGGLDPGAADEPGGAADALGTPQTSPFAHERPWWGEPTLWLLVAAVLVVLGLLAFPALLPGVVVVLPFLWVSRRWRQRHPGT